MAKSRAQRKAEARRRRELGIEEERDSESKAQHETQMPETADVLEAELAMEHGGEEPIDPDAPVPAPAPAKVDRRERKRQEREAAQRAKDQAARRSAKEPVVEKQHGAIRTFFSSVIKELRKVQWPDRDTLVQASAVTLLFVAIAAAYLGVLDAIFSRLIDLLI